MNGELLLESRSGDHDLIESCLGQHPDSWRRFVDTYTPLVRKLVRDELARRRHEPCDADIDDLSENVMLSLLTRDCAALRQYDRRFAFSTWLGVLVRTAVHRQLRKRRPQAMGSTYDLVLVSTDGGPDEGLLRSETVELVREAMQELSPRDRLVLSLFYFDGADYKLISQVTGLHINSVGAALHRARARLKSHLELHGV